MLLDSAGLAARPRVQAEANLKRLDKSELDQYAALLAMENPDLYKWLTGQEAIPDNVQNDLLRQLCSVEQHRRQGTTACTTGS